MHETAVPAPHNKPPLRLDLASVSLGRTCGTGGTYITSGFPAIALSYRARESSPRAPS